VSVSPAPPSPRRARRLPARTLGIISASCLVVPLTAATARAAVPYPKPDQPLPNALDVITPYQRGTLCLTSTQPGVTEFAKLLNATYGTHRYGTLRTCAAEHGEGRALDWMLDATKPDQLALGNALTRWLSAPDSQGRPGAMARRFGINYIIWNRQQWYAWSPDMAWKAYYGSSPHTDHIHFSFNWDGALENTSWWSGRAVTRPATGPDDAASTLVTPDTLESYLGTTLRQGSSGTAVKVAQIALGKLTVDGAFGPLTEARVREYQKSKGLTVNGVVDTPVWKALIADTLRSAMDRYASKGTTLSRGSSGEAVRVLQRAIGKLAIDGSFGPLTEGRVEEYQKSKGLPVTGVVDTAVWNVLLGRSSGGGYDLSDYVDTTLRRGSTGEAVKALQQAIGGLAVDGAFGPLTEARVEEYQKSKGLPVTGVVDAAVWNALMGKSTSGDSTTTTNPLAQYADVTLKLWSRGEAVKALQKALGGLTVDGVFGPLTEGRVKEYQKSKGLTVNGVVDSKVWNALMGKTTSGSSSSTPDLSKYVDTTLRRGSTGKAVTALQKAIGGLTADGIFGPLTEGRVKEYQKSKGLTVNGVVDSKVWNALMGKSTSSGSTSTSSPLSQYVDVTLKLWSRGEAVKALQKALGGLTVDGVFGPLTEGRVKAYEKSKGMTQDGVVDSTLWKALIADGGSAGSDGGTGGSTDGATTADLSTEFTSLKSTTLKRGATGSAVKTLQRGLGGLTVDGAFGPLTEARVKDLQKSKGLSQTGVVDKATWDAVELRAHPTLPYWTTVLKRGSTGAAVKALQREIGGLGVDGVFGPLTEAAVKNVQKAAGLTQTGVVGTVTWRAVDKG
jgi:peptidoglycan hydrolase-like protein with peptidoglycan-binding domain